MKNSETLRALMEENEKNNKTSAARDSRGLKEVRPAAPVKTVASNPHFKVTFVKKLRILASPSCHALNHHTWNEIMKQLKTFAHRKRNDLSVIGDGFIRQKEHFHD